MFEKYHDRLQKSWDKMKNFAKAHPYKALAYGIVGAAVLSVAIGAATAGGGPLAFAGVIGISYATYKAAPYIYKGYQELTGKSKQPDPKVYTLSNSPEKTRSRENQMNKEMGYDKGMNKEMPPVLAFSERQAQKRSRMQDFVEIPPEQMVKVRSFMSHQQKNGMSQPKTNDMSRNM